MFPKLKKAVEFKGDRTVIGSLAIAEKFFTSKRLYAVNMYCKQKSETFNHFNKDEYMHLISTYMNEYKHLDDGQNII